MNHNPLQRKLRSRGKKRPYKPGTIGLSNVSSQILEQYGHFPSRRERKDVAKTFNNKFVPIIGGW